jgi:hypothetical protein
MNMLTAQVNRHLTQSSGVEKEIGTKGRQRCLA